MSTTSNVHLHPDLVSVVGHQRTDEAVAEAAPSKAELYALAEQRMRHGQRLVMGGFVVAVLGIVAYCVVCLSASVGLEVGSTASEGSAWLVGPTLGVIGLGTLLWLVGSFNYFNGAMDSDPSGPDLYF